MCAHVYVSNQSEKFILYILLELSVHEGILSPFLFIMANNAYDLSYFNIIVVVASWRVAPGYQLSESCLCHILSNFFNNGCNSDLQDVQRSRFSQMAFC